MPSLTSRPCALPGQVAKEVEQYGDIVLVREKTTYKSILLKTFFVLEYALRHYDVRYVLKTDDDAFVHVGALVRQLRMLCLTPDCRCALRGFLGAQIRG
jgi:hypothetical protein